MPTDKPKLLSADPQAGLLSDDPNAGIVQTEAKDEARPVSALRAKILAKYPNSKEAVLVEMDRFDAMNQRVTDATLGKVVKGAKRVWSGRTIDDRLAGAAEALVGAGTTAAGLFAPRLLSAAAAAPLATVATVTGGAVGAPVARAIAERAGAGPGAQDLAEVAGGMVGGTVGNVSGRQMSRMLPAALKREAGQGFQQTAAAMKDTPITLSPEAGDQALRVFDLAQRGGTMPKAVGDLVKRVTNPKKSADLTWQEFRDFYHNISSLSASERMSMKGPMKMEVAKLRVEMDRVGRDAAKAGGTEKAYADAMKKYRIASRVDDFVDKYGEQIVTYALRGLGLSAGGALGYKLLVD